MISPEKSIELIFNPDISFEERCWAIFQFQINNNPIYRRFAETFGIKSGTAVDSKEIPLLPIRAFKDGRIVVDSSQEHPDLIFRSSGTSEMTRSTHYILNRKLYETAILTEFQKHFPFDEYSIAFYLPGYEDNPQSSLIWMAKHLTHSDPTGQSRFIAFEDAVDLNAFFNIENDSKRVLLFGAAFGLMDLLESEKITPAENMEILETGGMKTHRREMTKPELRRALSDGFQIRGKCIHSEYGMCELLSQMYAVGGEWFQAPHWVRVSIRDPKNPFRICETGEEGKIGIIDLANIYSCPFILTDDRGVMDSAGRFQVLGRWNPGDLRGCNFLIDRE